MRVAELQGPGNPTPERVIVTGAEWKRRRTPTGSSQQRADKSLEELRELAESAGAAVVDAVLQIREAPEAATLIGSGKVSELARLAGCGSHSGQISENLIKQAVEMLPNAEVRCQDGDRGW